MISLKQQVRDGVLNAIVKVFGFNRAGKIMCHLAGRIAPVYRQMHGGRAYLFHCPNPLTLWRARTFFTKEPETIEWIQSFRSGDVLFDIGANIGLYSIYAASRGVRVIAFEPEAQNYAELNKNIFLNELSDSVQALCVALTDSEAVDFLYLSQFQAGAALSTFGTTRDFRGEEFRPAFKQGMLSASLDDFLKRFPHPFPQHLKIDVDGLEAAIIRGAQQTLSDPRLQSIMVELCDESVRDRQVPEELMRMGWELVSKNQSPLIEQDAPQSRVYNYLFKRKGTLHGT